MNPIGKSEVDSCRASAAHVPTEVEGRTTLCRANPTQSSEKKKAGGDGWHCPGRLATRRAAGRCVVVWWQWQWQCQCPALARHGSHVMYSCVVAGRARPRSCAALSRVRFQFTSGRGGGAAPSPGRPAWAKRNRVYPTCSRRGPCSSARPRLLIKLNFVPDLLFPLFQAMLQVLLFDVVVDYWNTKF